jgi:hypothetical protein
VGSLLLQSLPPSCFAVILEFRRPYLNSQSLIGCQSFSAALANHARGLKVTVHTAVPQFPSKHFVALTACRLHFRTNVFSVNKMMYLFSVAPSSLSSSSLAVLLPHYFSSDFRNFRDKCAVLFG